MKKYKVTTTILSWRYGTVLSKTKDTEQYVAEGAIVGDNALVEEQIPHLLAAGMLEEVIEPVEKDYKITGRSYKKSITQPGTEVHKILSVIKIKGNKKFAIGDKVTCIDEDEIVEKVGVIEEFWENQRGLRMRVNTGVFSVVIGINEVELHIEKPVLFTGEDGKEIRLGDDFYCVHPSWSYYKITADEMQKSKHTHAGGFKNFSTKEAAEEYIINNKPVFTLQDMRNSEVAGVMGLCSNYDWKEQAKKRCGLNEN